MKIGLLENGIDSLQRGFKSFLDYEESTVSKPPDSDDYFHLKQAVLSTHHGVEILMKYILAQKSEFLIVSKFDKAYMQAYREKERFSKSSVFVTTQSEAVHTITYEEALERLSYFSGLKITPQFDEKLKKLNKIRNALTHAEIDIPDIEVTSLFQTLLNEIDVFFFKSIGDNYKTLSGYGSLVSNYESYMKYLEEQNMAVKKKAIEAFRSAVDKAGISIGENEIKSTSDITQAKQLIAEITAHDLALGMDMFNGYCSGDVCLEIVDDTHLSIYAKDNREKYRFKFKSVIVSFPPVASNESPVLIFESDQDNGFDAIYGAQINNDSYGCRSFEGICFMDNSPPRITYDLGEIRSFYTRCEHDEYFHIPPYCVIENFLSSRIFACINVQGLQYWDFPDLFAQVEGLSGQQVEVYLRDTRKL